MGVDTKMNLIGKYVLIRGDRSGVFAGILKEQLQCEVVLKNARRIWYWEGAATLSQLAITGPMKPLKCKFPMVLKEILVIDAVEVIPCTLRARKAIEKVPVWREN